MTSSAATCILLKTQSCKNISQIYSRPPDYTNSLARWSTFIRVRANLRPISHSDQQSTDLVKAYRVTSTTSRGSWARMAPLRYKERGCWWSPSSAQSRSATIRERVVSWCKYLAVSSVLISCISATNLETYLRLFWVSSYLAAYSFCPLSRLGCILSVLTCQLCLWNILECKDQNSSRKALQQGVFSSESTEPIWVSLRWHCAYLIFIILRSPSNWLTPTGRLKRGVSWAMRCGSSSISPQMHMVSTQQQPRKIRWSVVTLFTDTNMS